MEKKSVSFIEEKNIYIWVNTHKYKKVLIITLFISKGKLTKPLYSKIRKLKHCCIHSKQEMRIFLNQVGRG